ncbi:hypothetical protein [Arthrobacter rhizosphaerae]|uniref:hypothetical protein n=1 Tax=Arthrobacter rhizosphaerae TaxID=2855490 RepID=UPI001FF4F217|nr:hypothetical protein [Arthrobacter rhizosphaerae]
MTMGDLWPLLRPVCRRLALLGWASSAAGMAAGLAVAVASGTSLSPAMATLQRVSSAGIVLAVFSFTAAVFLQPHQERAAEAAREAAPDTGEALPSTLRSFLPGTVVLLLGAVAFAGAGLLLRSGPSPQSVAFCQVFGLAAAASGFTYLLFTRAAPHPPTENRPSSPPPES